MKYDVIVGTRSGEVHAELGLEKDAFTYIRDGGVCVTKGYSIVAADRGRYSVIVEGRSYQVTLASAGEVTVNGRTFQIEVLDPRKLRGRGAAGHTQGRQTVAAAMPGRVIRVLVEIGQEVEAGQGLIVVEAMKMQNEMKSPQAGTVREIRTAAGAAVAVGDPLITIE